MNRTLATILHENGKAHAEASCLLFSASFDQAKLEGVEDPAKYAFNGPYSLSVQYLLGLGLELMLKSAIAACDAEVGSEYLRKEIGHDLVRSFEEAERRGFKSQAPFLREIVQLLRDPYKQHWFRYERPEQMRLPGDFDQVVETLVVLESELARKLGSE